MASPSPWRNFYESHPSGRFRITSPALMAFRLRHRSRILLLPLAGRPHKVLLFDQPLRLGDKVLGSELDEFVLHRIRLRELPGWPPRLQVETEWPKPFSLFDSKLMSVKYEPARPASQSRMAFDLEHHSQKNRAFMSGLPPKLFRCLDATLRQDGALGTKISDLQEMRLICPD